MVELIFRHCSLVISTEHRFLDVNYIEVEHFDLIVLCTVNLVGLLYLEQQKINQREREIISAEAMQQRKMGGNVIKRDMFTTGPKYHEHKSIN